MLTENRRSVSHKVPSALKADERGSIKNHRPVSHKVPSALKADERGSFAEEFSFFGTRGVQGYDEPRKRK